MGSDSTVNVLTSDDLLEGLTTDDGLNGLSTDNVSVGHSTANNDSVNGSGAATDEVADKTTGREIPWKSHLRPRRRRHQQAASCLGYLHKDRDL